MSRTILALLAVLVFVVGGILGWVTRNNNFGANLASGNSGENSGFVQVSAPEQAQLVSVMAALDVPATPQSGFSGDNLVNISAALSALQERSNQVAAAFAERDKAVEEARKEAQAAFEQKEADLTALLTEDREHLLGMLESTRVALAESKDETYELRNLVNLLRAERYASGADFSAALSALQERSNQVAAAFAERDKAVEEARKEAQAAFEQKEADLTALLAVERKDLLDMVGALEGDVEAREAEIAAEQQAAAETQQKYDEILGEVTALQLERDALINTISALEEVFVAREAEIEAEQQAAAETQQKYDEILGEVTALQLERDALAAEKSRLSDLVSVAEERLLAIGDLDNVALIILSPLLFVGGDPDDGIGGTGIEDGIGGTGIEDGIGLESPADTVK